jgi:hypothetical protein
MIIIVKYRAFDKSHEKVFYDGQSWAEIHQALSDICRTYVPLEVITATLMNPTPQLIDYLKTHQTSHV